MEEPGSILSTRTGDFNGDGIDEVVTIRNANLPAFSIWTLDTATEKWIPRTYSLPAFPGDLRIIDINADGHQDVVMSFATATRVFVGNGTGHVFPFPDLPGDANLPFRSLSFGDIDEDGDLDIVGSNSSGTTVILVDTALNATSLTNIPDAAFSSAVGDFDGDQHLDIAVSIQLSPFPQLFELGVYYGDGQGGFSPLVSQPAISSSANLTVVSGDLNGDGTDDLVTGGDDLQVILGQTGPLVPGSSFSIPGESFGRPEIGDLNGDGLADLAVNTITNFLYSAAGDGTGSFGPPRLSLRASSFGTNSETSIAIGQLDGDGVKDIVAGGFGAEILLADHPFAYGPVRVLDLETDRFDGRMATGDFDGDGNRDIALLGTNASMVPNVHVYFGDGDARFPVFTTVTMSTPGAVTTDITAADVNGDGLDDIVVGNSAPALGTPVFVFRSDGFQNFTVLSPTITSPSVTSRVVSADFDRDGKAELLLAGIGAVHVIQDLDTPTAATTTLSTTNGVIGGIDAADVDRDGFDDIIATSGAALQVFSASGIGAPFQVTNQINLGSLVPLDVEVVDADSDGITDFVLTFTGRAGIVRGLEFEVEPLSHFFAYGLQSVKALNAGGDESIELVYNQEFQGIFARRADDFSFLEALRYGTTSLLSVDDFNGDRSDDLLVRLAPSTLAIFPTAPDLAHRGTMESARLATSTGGAPRDSWPVKGGREAEFFDIRLELSNDTFLGAPAVLLGQLLATGDRPTAPTGGAGLLIDPTAPLPPFVVAQSNAVSSTGLSVSGQWPLQIDGVSLFVQGIISSPAAGNGQFATTDLHEIRLHDIPSPRIDTITNPYPLQGEQISVHGEFFAPSAVVRIDGQFVTPISRSHDHIGISIGAPLPCDTTLEVMNPNGGTVTVPFNESPVISAVLPSDSVVFGGDRLTLIGSFLDPFVDVTLDGTPINLIVRMEDRLEFDLPFGSVGVAMLRVETRNGCFDEIPINYTGAPPVITSIAPEIPTPGDLVTIEGHSFSPAAVVIVDGVPLPTMVFGNTVQFTAPGTIPCDVLLEVENPGSGTATRIWNRSASIHDVVPRSTDAMAGSVITLTGRFLSGHTFALGNRTLTPDVVTADYVELSVPPGLAGPADVRVRNATGCDVVFPFRRSSLAPVISSIAPSSAAAGDTVLIEGRRLRQGLIIEISGVTVMPDTVIGDKVTFTVPPGVECASSLTVRNTDGRTASITFNPPPTIRSLSESSGPFFGGQVLSVAGFDLSPTAQVFLGGAPVTSFLIRTPNLFVFVTPPGAPGTVPLTFVQASGCSASVPYTYTP